MECVVEIREHALLFLIGKYSRGKFDVSNKFRIDSEEPLIVKGDFIFNTQLLEEVKKQLKSKKLKMRKVKVIVNHRSIVTRDLIVPYVDKRKMSLIIENEMYNIYHLSRDYLVDYRTIEEQKKGRKVKQVQVIASAISSKFIQSLELFFDKNRMNIVSIETAASSIMNLIEKQKMIKNPEPSVVVELNSSYIRSFIYDNYAFQIARTVYIQEETSEVAVDRLVQVLDILNQSYSGKTGKNLKHVMLIGKVEYLPLLQSHYTGESQLEINLINLNHFLVRKQPELMEYASCLGVVL